MKEDVGSSPSVHGAGSEEAKKIPVPQWKTLSHTNVSGPPTESGQSHLLSICI